jgi:hypothetical protein
MILSPARTTDQNIWADLPKNQRDAQYPIPGEQQKELAKWLAESESAFLLVETSLVPPLKCCAVIRHTGRTGHRTCDLIIQPIITIVNESSPEGVNWVDDGPMLEISCLIPEAESVAMSILPRMGNHLLYDFPQLSGDSREDRPGSGSIRLATKGARYMQQAREQAAARAAAVGGAGR